MVRHFDIDDRSLGVQHLPYRESFDLTVYLNGGAFNAERSQIVQGLPYRLVKANAGVLTLPPLIQYF